jgi:hypothetical protein
MVTSKAQFLRSLSSLVAAATLVFAPCANAKSSDDVRLEAVRVQFLYQTTGTLSEDLVQKSEFASWNTIIGGGDAKEPAEDVLVSAVLESDSNESKTGKLVLTVIADRQGSGAKVLGRHTFNGALMLKGQLVQSILLHNATCAGTITVEATYGKQHKVAKIDMACGE